ncbi:MAG: hypothetical protein ACQEUT_18885 [Bacillota bacterium]
MNSKPSGILLKLLPFVIPQVIVESIAERKTDLIPWKKGWTGYHTFLSLSVKLLICRGIISLVRIINNQTLSVKSTPTHNELLFDDKNKNKNASH